MASLADYENLLAPARQRFAESFGVRALQSNGDAAVCELFLIFFCALGVRMTRPVGDWIQRAAARCTAIGFSELGRALKRHASAEANHHLLMIDDLRSLVARWNACRAPSLDADALLGRSASPGTARYCKLHEDSIASETPFAQVAIEYEIEMLPSRYGDLVIGRCFELLGADILSCLSFITQHIALDGAHTDFNARALGDLIERAPWTLPSLASAGRAALEAYGQFLGDCVRLAEEHARSAKNRRNIDPPSLRWQIKAPPGCENGCSSLDWLKEVRALRGRVLFDNGRRPAFRIENGEFCDEDPIDVRAFHVLAYDGAPLVGCVRLYRLDPEGPPCVTEKILGRRVFSQMLQTLGANRTEIVEIGRWTVDPGYRAARHDLGLSLQLAAASAAVAKTLGEASGASRGFAICAAGTKGRQDRMIARFGMAPVLGIDPTYCEDYKDDVRVLCCSQIQQLDPQFKGLVNKMAKEMALEEFP
jgi:hypothetical protein